MEDEDAFPSGQTCGNSLEIPAYGSIEVMRSKLTIAIRMCGNIDMDEDYIDMSDASGEGYGLDV